MLKKIIFRGSGKLIISGEYAVIYGLPALVISINKYIFVDINHQRRNCVTFNFFNWQYKISYSLIELKKLKALVKSRYFDYLNNKILIQDVLTNPYQLAAFLVIEFIEKFNIKMFHGFVINILSEIPFGSGMGSSAALVMTILYNMSYFFNITLNLKKLLGIGKCVESLQHGFSSGVDLYSVVYGGYIYYENYKVNQYNINLNSNIFIVNTGQPESSTGECVSKVFKLFNDILLEKFHKVIKKIHNALLFNNMLDFMMGIKENHFLLETISVVPENISYFIKDIEKIGGAGKICGAGSILGNKGGIVLIVYYKDKSQLINIVNNHGYILEKIDINLSGISFV